MDKFEPTTVIGIIGGIVVVITVLVRVVEMLVKYVIDEHKQKKLKAEKKRKGGYTADLAVQRRVLDDVQDDVESLAKAAQRIESMVEKDIPHQLGTTHAEVRELRTSMESVRGALEANTAATNRLYEMLAKVLKQ